MFLTQQGYDIVGYDKHFTGTEHLNCDTYDIVVCNYVLNVIPYIDERLMVLHDIKDLLKSDGHAYITVRHKSEESSLKDKIKLNDGWLTNKKTFQKFYTGEELVEFLSEVFDEVKLIYKNPVICEVKKALKH